MTEDTEIHTFPRWLLHAKCKSDNPVNHNYEGQSCAEKDEQDAWALIVNKAGLNADMKAQVQHSDHEFAWTFDRGDTDG